MLSVFRRWQADRREFWGYGFEWTADHLTPEQLRPLMFSYDVLGSEALDRLDEISPPRRETPVEQFPAAPVKHSRQDHYAVLKANADKDEKLGELWKQVTTVPEWVDWPQIERGQKVFHRYGAPAMVAVSGPP